MARETKVGLLAGLAFIVVFAMILANRGQQDPLLSQQTLSDTPQVVLGEHIVPQTIVPATQIPERVAPHRAEPTGVGYSDRSGDPGVLRGDQTAAANPPAHRQQTATRTITFAPEKHTPTRSSQVAIQAYQNRHEGSRLSPVEPTPTQVTHGNPRVLSPQREKPGTQPSRSPTFRQTARASGTASSIGTKYVVLAGDTLYSIAGRHYGKRSGKYVRAIVEANRATLSDPDALKVGAILALPVLDHDGATSTVSKTLASQVPTARAGKNVIRPHNEPFDWYQVQKGDGYASIARDKLGDVTRWHELFELNKEKFSDPDRIRDGVLIKIPRGTRGARH